MSGKSEPILHGELSQKIIGAFYTVYNAMGYGFLERLYEKALAHELGKHDLLVVQQAPIAVMYDGILLGEFYADLLVEGKIIVELKAVEALRKEHEAQLLNYLRATDIEVGLLFNFGPKAQIVRRVYSNNQPSPKHPRKSTLISANPRVIRR